MGYMMILAPCCACGDRISFNPDLVPSIRDKGGHRQPICKDCVQLWNERRQAAGKPTFSIPRGAYEPQEVAG